MITQFSINLNKGEDLAEREARWRKRREVITLVILVLFVATLSLINVQQYKTIEGLVETKQNTIRDIDRQLDSLKKTGKNISKEDVLALAKLEKERVLWTKKFLAIGQLIPEEMAMTYMEYKNQTLLLRFISVIKKDEKEFDRVKEIIEKLKSSPLFFKDFMEMRLKEQHQTEIEDQTILSFSVLSRIGRSGSAVETRRTSSRSSRTTAAQRLTR